MSSSYSALIDYGSVKPYQPDFQLISTALQAKQTKLDTNRAKLQSYRDQLGVIDLAKDADGEYLDMKLQQVTDISNQYANGDLSNDNLANSLISNMGQVLDANVKNAIIGTKILRNEQAEWTEIKKKDPKLYSDTNYAFAMQRANSWLNDGKTGTTYNGGGSFIEYVDVEKEISDKLPEALKIIREKNKTTVYKKGEGDLVGQDVTTDSVSKAEVDAALETLISEKGRRQLQINAWSEFDKLPEENLSEIYAQKVNSKLESINSRLETVTANYNVSKSADAKQEIELLKSQKAQLEDDKDFQDRKAKIGIQGIYTNLYYDNFKSNYTDLYSGTRVVDTKINETDKFNFNTRIALENLDINKKKLALEEKKAETVGTGDAFLRGPELPVVSKETKGAIFNEKMDAETKIISGVAIGLGKAMGVQDQDAVDKIIRSKEFSAIMMSDLAGKKNITLTVNGKQRTVSLTKELRMQILDMKDVLNNPAKKDAYGQISTSLDKATTLLGLGLVNKDTESYNIPNFNLRHIKTDAGWTIKKVDFKKGDNYYAYLLKQKASGKDLSEKAKKDLKLFQALHLMNDGNIEDQERGLIKDYLVGDVLSDVDAKGCNTVNLKVKTKSGEIMTNSYSKIPDTQDLWLSEVSKGDVEGSAANRFREGVVKAVATVPMALASGITGIFSQDAANYIGEKTASMWDSSNIQGIDNLLFDKSTGLLTTIKRGLGEVYSREYNLADVEGTVLPYSRDKDKYIRSAAALGFDRPGTADITFIPEMSAEGIPTEKLIAKRYVGKGTKAQGYAPQYEYSEPIKSERLKELQIVAFDLKPDTRYDASEPNARSLGLGTGSYIGDIDKGFDEKTEKSLIKRASEYGEKVVSATNSVISSYENGVYEVKLEPIEGQYMFKVYDKTTGKEPLSGYTLPFDSPLTRLKSEKITDLLENPKNTVDTVLIDFIERYQEYLRKALR